jgi:hypothetical protein
VDIKAMREEITEEAEHVFSKGTGLSYIAETWGDELRNISMEIRNDIGNDVVLNDPAHDDLVTIDDIRLPIPVAAILTDAKVRKVLQALMSEKNSIKFALGAVLGFANGAHYVGEKLDIGAALKHIEEAAREEGYESGYENAQDNVYDWHTCDHDDCYTQESHDQLLYEREQEVRKEVQDELDEQRLEIEGTLAEAKERWEDEFLSGYEDAITARADKLAQEKLEEFKKGGGADPTINKWLMDAYERGKTDGKAEAYEAAGKKAAAISSW